ncbi:MAG: TonB-dependent receptor plug domain-containing protein [Limisphaerales bacterium]
MNPLSFWPSRISPSFIPVAILSLASSTGHTQSPPPQSTAPSPSQKWDELAPLFISATRIPSTLEDQPSSVSVVDQATFDRIQPRTTPEAFKEVPSVMIQKTAHGQGSPFIRGFTGFRTLLLIDGIRLNNSTYREGPNQYWNTVDPLSVDRLEVVRGPSSVLYGSDAIGGTVNAITESRTQFGPGFGWNPRASYRYSSAEDSHIGRAEAGANFGEQVGVQAGVSVKDFGDVRGGEDVGLQSKTGYREWDADAKVQWLIQPNQQLVYAHQTVDQDDAWRTHSTIYGKSWRGTTVGTDQARILDQFRNLDYLQYHAVALDGFVEEVHAHVSFQSQDDDENRVRSDGRQEVQGTYVDTLGLSLQFQSPSSVGRWVYGAEYYHDWVDSFYRRYSATGSLQQTRRQGPVADGSSYDLAAAYVQDTISLFDDRLELSVGGRYEFASADVGSAEASGTREPLSFSDSWDNLVGSGRFMAKIDEEGQWRLFGGVSQGFRAPNLSDLSRFDIANSGELEVPVFDLDPENYVSVEAGLRTQWGPIRAETAVYKTWIDDQIVRVVTGTTAPTGEAIVTKKNSGNGQIHGAEATVSAEITPEWTLWGTFTWMEGTLDTPVTAGGPEVTEPVSRLMPTTLQLGIRWEASNRKFWAEFATTIAATQNRLSASDQRDTQRIPPGGTPGYEVYNLRGGWRPTKNTALTLAFENLSNADYRIHGSGLNEPGQNLIVGLDLHF